jgi:hypothetical protein
LAVSFYIYPFTLNVVLDKYMDISMDIDTTPSLRSGESCAAPLRSNRFFKQQDYWYFRTREGLDIGPFDQLIEAKEGVDGFIGFVQEAHTDVVTRITKYIKLQPRKGESNKIPARENRIFQQESYWYFRTREGMDIGPFDDRGSAAVGSKGFVSFLEESQPDIVSRVTHYISVA